MDKKISLNLPNQHYYIYVPSHANQVMFNSVFAFDALLNTLKQQDLIDVLGYCLLPTSLHLIVFSKSEPNNWLDPWLMQFNQWHQNTSGESGYLFADESKRQVLIQPRLLSKALKFIHNIPVSKKICSHPDQYLYSSYHDYIGRQNTGVITSHALASLSPNSGQRIRRFEDYTASKDSINNIDLANGNNQFYYAYADRAYVTKAMSLYASGQSDDSEQQELASWNNCIQVLSGLTQLDTPTLLGIRRHHSLPDAHFLLAWLYTEIAKGPMFIAAKQLSIDELTLKLNINSIHLHHPEAYLRYIANSWQSNSKVA